MSTRRIRTNKKEQDAILLNYQQNVVKEVIDPDSVPNTVPSTALKEFQKDDPEPYYKVQKIEYPVVANGINYPESFFKSFISKLKERPIPGSKTGHSVFWGERPNTDFIMVGGKIESKGNGKGFVYFKNYIPPAGAETSNDTFIRENKADMVHFSLVTYPEYHITEDKDGNEEVNAISSLKGERNDAVEWGLGAMGQETNAVADQRIMSKSRSNARSKINSGNYDNSSSWSFSASDGNNLLGENGDNWTEYALWHMVEDTSAETETKARYKYPYGKNGKVYRSALRAIASRAGQQGLDDLSNLASELIDLIDKKEGGENNLNKDELFKVLNTMKANADITLIEVAEAMGLKNQIITDEQLEALKIVNSLKDLGLKDPVKDYEKVKNTIEANKESVRNARLDKEYGTEKDPVTNKENLLRHYAGQKAAGLDGDALENAIKELKDDPIAKRFAAERADYNSEANEIGVVENRNDNGKEKNKVFTEKVVVL